MLVYSASVLYSSSGIPRALPFLAPRHLIFRSATPTPSSASTTKSCYDGAGRIRLPGQTSRTKAAPTISIGQHLDLKILHSASFCKGMKLLALSFILTVVVDGATATSSVRKRTNVDEEKLEGMNGGEKNFSVEDLDDDDREELQSALMRVSQHGTKKLVRHISASLHGVLDDVAAADDAGADVEARKLISQTCMDQTDLLYDKIDAEVTALFAPNQPCGPSVTLLPSITATIDHDSAQGCVGEVVTTYEQACTANNGTSIRVDLKADCNVVGILPFGLPAPVKFVGNDLHVCVSAGCGASELSNIDTDAATDLLNAFKGDISDGFGLEGLNLACGVQSVEPIEIPAAQTAVEESMVLTNSTNTTEVGTNMTNSTPKMSDDMA